MPARNRAEQVIYKRAYLAIGFRGVLFPIDVGLLLKILPEAGYALAEDVARFALSGRAQAISIRGDNIARKGDFSLALNSDRGFIGVDGPGPQETAEEFSSLEEFLKEKLEVNLQEKATFYEFLAVGALPSNVTPLQTFASLSKELPITKTLTRVLGTEVALFGLRLVPLNQDPNQADWFDITLEPSVEHVARYYNFSGVFRRATREPVIEFAKRFSETILEIVSCLERS